MKYIKQLKKLSLDFQGLDRRNKLIYIGVFLFAAIVIFVASAGITGCLEGMSSVIDGEAKHSAIWYGINHHFFGSLLLSLVIMAVILFFICKAQISQGGDDF